MRLYDEFDTKKQANKLAESLRKQGVQYVRVKESGTKNKDYKVYVGGKNSRNY